jgi:hypothetical protein
VTIRSECREDLLHLGLLIPFKIEAMRDKSAFAIQQVILIHPLSLTIGGQSGDFFIKVLRVIVRPHFGEFKCVEQDHLATLAPDEGDQTGVSIESQLFVRGVSDQLVFLLLKMLLG